MDRYVCIHGHFYQPPRENPWLEEIEVQDSAAPYHDWNERITAECYAPNSASRIVDGDRRILDIVSNYAKMSFNFGPTLLSWMEKASPDVYQAILDADRQSMEWRSGHGAALAQVYNHMIMPLASPRDKRTQVIWGIRDFEHRFGRFPEGMWLAETAVDLETLDVLAEQGIAFTILAPHQAAGYRRIGESNWTETNGASIDPSRAYLCPLPSGRSITLFFYDRLAQAVAFEKVLNDGEGFAQRLMEIQSDLRDWPQLLHIATDGETYGHHQTFGDMALAATFNHIESNNLAKLTNYGEYLELHPPDHEVRIHENTSWSCAHGVERWRSDCGCNSGGYPHWNQQWRGPLRAALDWLRDRLVTEFSRATSKLFKDPWLARNEYVQVILDRRAESVEKFIARHSVVPLTAEEIVTVVRLLEMQRHSLLMYTSCGWFFDELSGLETVQVIQYASRALQLGAGIIEQGTEQAFVEKLKSANSNIPEIGDGAWIYEHFVLPTRVDLNKVVAHFAFSSMFEEYEDQTKIFCYLIEKQGYLKLCSEEVCIAVGLVDAISVTTGESGRFTFGVVRFGSHDFKGGVTIFRDQSNFESMREAMVGIFDRGLYTELIGIMDTHFGTHSYSFNDLFKDEQRKILDSIITRTLDQFTESYKEMYEHCRPLMEFMREYSVPVPKTFLAAAGPALSEQLISTLTPEEPDVQAVKRIVEQIGKWNVEITTPHTEFFMRKLLENLMAALVRNPEDMKLIARLQTLMGLLQALPQAIAYWQVQNDYYRLAKNRYQEFLTKARNGDEDAVAWVKEFRQLGEMLYFNLGAIVPE
ncbi:DUF3536 domain-containing protein [Pelotalea chapellei]|uniref:DUF3536 domain-containing protein n=1 Tax=Pelotalea chapellei TaxID=44671 RepID=A0ABS5U9Q7_9BACT|nr:DUF3536 domain-containing protein [Pelotalea chapellei]MBT1072381.1 DUF3536 domain-containing protein [Pelotalea chapellei]